MRRCNWNYVAEVKSDTGRRFQILTDKEIVALAVAESLGGYYREIKKMTMDEYRENESRSDTRKTDDDEIIEKVIELLDDANLEAKKISERNPMKRRIIRAIDNLSASIYTEW